MPERRPHLTRPCPLHTSHHCDWVQVTSWYVGGPNKTVPVPEKKLRHDAELHLESHFGLERTYFT